MQLYRVRWCTGNRRKALPPSCARHEVRRAMALYGRKAHLCQVACRRRSVKVGLRRPSRRKRHARSRCRAHLLRRLWCLSKVVLRGRALHSRRGHWDRRCIVTDRTECLRISSVSAKAPVSRRMFSYLAWPAHREHAAFLRHDGRMMIFKFKEGVVCCDYAEFVGQVQEYARCSNVQARIVCSIISG